jgi:hypothetical protein
MKVLSPGTTSSVSRCYNTGSRNTEQLVDIPPVIYVQAVRRRAASATRTRLGARTRTASLTTKYDCSYGNAFVSGRLSAARHAAPPATTSWSPGNTTYKTGSPARTPSASSAGFRLDLPPGDDRGANVLPATETVQHLDAAILSVGAQLPVQNYDTGRA